MSFSEKVRDYADMETEWPMTAGFETCIEQREPIELEVQGRIPAYAAGTLYRTGPGGYKVETANGKTWAASHWFDGLSQIHRFKITAPKDGLGNCTVRHNSRRTVDHLIESIKKNGSLKEVSFGQKRDPCESYFKKAMSVFHTAKSGIISPKVIEPSSLNIGVTLTANMPGLSPNPTTKDRTLVNGHTNEIKTLHSKTDATVYQASDPETLEPINVTRQSQQHAELKGALSSAHPKSDPDTGDLFNYNLELSSNPRYRVFRVSASTGKTDILATIAAPAAYVHSILITADHVILCLWNSHLSKSGLDVVLKQNMLEAIFFDAEKPAKWYVVDRKHNKGLLAVYESPAFYCFHTVNAWQEPSPENPQQTDIVAELIKYENLDILKRLYYENLLGLSPSYKNYYGEKGSSSRQNMCRYRLPNVPATEPRPDGPATLTKIEYVAPKTVSPELPTINPRYLTRAHRYTYGGADRSSYAVLYDSLVKWDSDKQSATYWSQQGHTPGEPIFVVDPEGSEEDDGVLLSVVLDGYSERSYLLCLSAKTMEEMGRAEMNMVVGFGFHGCHVSTQGNASSAD